MSWKTSITFKLKKSHPVEERYIRVCARKGLLKKKSSYRQEVTTVSLPLVVCALLLSFCTPPCLRRGWRQPHSWPREGTRGCSQKSPSDFIYGYNGGDRRSSSLPFFIPLEGNSIEFPACEEVHPWKEPAKSSIMGLLFQNIDDPFLPASGNSQHYWKSLVKNSSHF